MKRNLILSAVALLVILSGSVFLWTTFSTKHEALSLDERLVTAIVETIPAFSHDGEPVFTIHSISHPSDEWYIVTIKSLRSSEDFVPVKLIMVNTGDGFNVVAGPDTSFTEPELLKINAPDPVILELEKS